LLSFIAVSATKMRQLLEPRLSALYCDFNRLQRSNPSGCYTQVSGLSVVIKSDTVGQIKCRLMQLADVLLIVFAAQCLLRRKILIHLLMFTRLF